MRYRKIKIQWYRKRPIEIGANTENSATSNWVSSAFRLWRVLAIGTMSSHSLWFGHIACLSQLGEGGSFTCSNDFYLPSRCLESAPYDVGFLYFFCGLECVGHSFAYVTHFYIFERCLDSNPECCRNKQARYQHRHPSYSHSHPSPDIATHLPCRVTYYKYNVSILESMTFFPSCRREIHGACQFLSRYFKPKKNC